MTDEQFQCSRRRVLLSGAAVGSLGAAGSMAGCLNLLPPVGQRVSYGRVDVPAAATATPQYRRWIPATAAVPDVETHGDPADISWLSVTPGTLGAETVGARFGVARAVIITQLDFLGYEFGDYDYVHAVDPFGVVAEGEIDRETVAETALDGGYSRDGTYHGWEVFDRTDIPRAIAVSDTAIVASRGEERRVFLETLVDAGDGRIERSHETDQSFARFTERVGTYPEMLEQFGYSVSPTEPQHAVMTYTFDEEGAYFVYHQLYADGETPSREALETELESKHERAVRAWSVDIRREDRYVRVEMRIKASEFTDGSSTDTLPHVMWGVDDAGRYVTVRHEAGDGVPVDRLEFEPDDALVETVESGTTLTPGDELTVDVETFPDEADNVSMVYNYTGTDQSSAMLFDYTPDRLDTN
jgi:hypothetical protein